MKPNLAELPDVTDVADPFAAARRLSLESGAAVAVTRGAAGMVLAVGDDAWHGSLDQVLRGNPTGAGDAALAAFARGLRLGSAWPEVLADAVALSGAAVLAPYAGEFAAADHLELAKRGRGRAGGGTHMTFARTGELVDAAVAAGRSVLALNVITLEHAEGILLGAARAERPVVLQVSENAIGYHDGVGEPLLRACAALVESHAATASLHLDHVTDARLLDLAVDELGVSSVMYDASALPDAENVASTRSVTELLHDRGLWVEAELGAIGGKGGAHDPGVRTVPAEAADIRRRDRRRRPRGRRRQHPRDDGTDRQPRLRADRVARRSGAGPAGAARLVGGAGRPAARGDRGRGCARSTSARH